MSFARVWTRFPTVVSRPRLRPSRNCSTVKARGAGLRLAVRPGVGRGDDRDDLYRPERRIRAGRPRRRRTRGYRGTGGRTDRGEAVLAEPVLDRGRGSGLPSLLPAADLRPALRRPL